MMVQSLSGEKHMTRSGSPQSTTPCLPSLSAIFRMRPKEKKRSRIQGTAAESGLWKFTLESHGRMTSQSNGRPY